MLKYAQLISSFFFKLNTSNLKFKQVSNIIIKILTLLKRFIKYYLECL